MEEPDLEAGLAYWTGIEATLDGVMGGFGKTSLPRVDAKGSRVLLKHLLRQMGAEEDKEEQVVVRVLDVGAGVGRVSSDVLLDPSLGVRHVDLLEPCAHFLQGAMDQAGSWPGLQTGSNKSASFWQGSLQDCDPADLAKSARLLGRTPAAGEEDDDDKHLPYRIIWCQWCLPHLSDPDLVQFFIRARKALAPGGYIVVKENLCKEMRRFDPQDSSVTRSEILFLKIFHKAGLKVVLSRVQHGLPRGLFQVKSFVLQPIEP